MASGRNKGGGGAVKLMSRALCSVTAIILGLAAGGAGAQGLMGQEPKVLDMTRGSWAYFRDYNGRQFIYFTHLEAYRCGISQVRYSLNTQALDKVWTLQPCDPKAPQKITTGTPYITLPLGTASKIAVQLTFNDGTRSTVVRIDSANQLIR
ncbi:MAG TPA: hypothetical protein ENH27_05490 [Rhizobiales bacterium]|nr:hypothetical protein [Hyphomicrobiales bacterium]